MIINTHRINILGVPVDVMDNQKAMAWVRKAVTIPGNKRIVAVNPEKIMAARKDRELKRFLQESDLLIPDGIGVVIAAKILGLGKMERVAGADLMPSICQLAHQLGLKIFIYGARPDVNQEARKKLLDKYPGLKIVGWSHGYIPEEKMGELISAINSSGADILFIALGSPKQEKWLAKYGPALKVKVSQCIGGTLDVISGKVKRAPKIFQKINLEWLYRLITEPKRFRRQIAIPLFIYLVILKKLSN